MSNNKPLSTSIFVFSCILFFGGCTFDYDESTPEELKTLRNKLITEFQHNDLIVGSDELSTVRIIFNNSEDIDLSSIENFKKAWIVGNYVYDNYFDIERVANIEIVYSTRKTRYLMLHTEEKVSYTFLRTEVDDDNDLETVVEEFKSLFKDF